MPRIPLPILLTTILGGGGVATVPDIAMPSTNLLAGWYAGNGTTIPATIEAAAGAPITDGGAIAEWNDVTAVYAPVQGTLAARPTYHVNGFGSNSRGYAEGDGGDSLSATIAAGILARDGLVLYSLYIVMSTTAIADQGLYSEGVSGNNTPFAHTRVNSSTVDGMLQGIRSTDSTAVNRTTGDVNFNDGNPHLYTGEITGGFLNQYKDGGAALNPIAVNFSAKTFGINRMALFALIQNGTISNQFVGKIAALYIYNEARNTSTENILKTFYGIA
jgi:hypothetical protein